MMWEHYGDVLVDVAGGWAYGVNGCTAENLVVEDDTIALTVKSDLHWDSPARITFRNVPSGKHRSPSTVRKSVNTMP